MLTTQSSPSPLAGFEGHFEAGKKRGKGRNGQGKERKEKD